MTPLRALLRAAAAGGLAALLGCASSGPAVAAPPCAGLTPPAFVVIGGVALPQTYVSARLAADVIEEIVVGRDGVVAGIRLVTTSVPPLAPFAEAALQHSTFTPGTIEGNPVAVRGWIKVPIGGIIRAGRREPPYDDLRAFVPGGGSREALWQLAGSVERLTLAARVGSAVPQGAAIVAVAPGGAEQTLLTIPAAPAPRDPRDREDRPILRGGGRLPAGAARGGEAARRDDRHDRGRIRDRDRERACEPLGLGRPKNRAGALAPARTRSPDSRTVL